MKKGDKLIEEVFNGMLVINVISLVSVMFCIIIDSIVTGQFLGTEAVTASGLLSPVVLFCNMICSLLGPGLGVVCTRYIGMGKIQKVRQVFSVVVLTAVILSVIVAVLLFYCSPVLADLLSAKAENPQVRQYIIDYLKGFSVGIPFSAFNITISAIMMIDNDKGRPVVSTMTVLIGDAVLDLANVLVFHGGMTGMALATSTSAVFGFVVLIFHFRKKTSIIHFTGDGLMLSDVKEVFLAGFAGSITQICSVIRGLVINQLLLSTAGEYEVAAIAVANNSFSILLSVFAAYFMSVSTISSMLYGEEDRDALVRIMGFAIRKMLLISGVMCGLYFVCANSIATLFLDKGSADIAAEAASFIRYMSVQYFFIAVVFPIGGGFIGVRRLDMYYIVCVLREAVFPIPSVMLCCLLFGVQGAKAGFPIAGILTLAAVFLYVGKEKRSFPRATKDLIMVPEGFGPDPDTVYEAFIDNDLDKVTAVSEEIRVFCLKRGAKSRTANLLALFVEEMGSNTIRHGFKTKKNGNVAIKLIYSEEKKAVRIRDNGIPFDPIKWLEGRERPDECSGIGIRMIIGMVDNIRYIPTLQMNNLIATL